MAPPRTIRLVHPLDDRGVGVFRITAGRRTHWYAFREIESQIGGRGFHVHKLGYGPVYDVRVGKPHDCTCECMGFYAHNSCKHIKGLKALIRAKKI